MQRQNAITVNLMIFLQPHSPGRDRLAVADVPGTSWRTSLRDQTLIKLRSDENDLELLSWFGY